MSVQCSNNTKYNLTKLSIRGFPHVLAEKGKQRDNDGCKLAMFDNEHSFGSHFMLQVVSNNWMHLSLPPHHTHPQTNWTNFPFPL